MPDGAFPPTLPVTRGRDGRLPRHAAGILTTTPANSSNRPAESEARPGVAPF